MLLESKLVIASFGIFLTLKMQFYLIANVLHLYMYFIFVLNCIRKVFKEITQQHTNRIYCIFNLRDC